METCLQVDLLVGFVSIWTDIALNNSIYIYREGEGDRLQPAKVTNLIDLQVSV